MKRITTFFIAIFLLLVFTDYAKATLYDLGGGLIYDDDTDITWMQSANYAGSTMTWDNAMTWVDNLVFQDYDDWRLPVTDTSCSKYDCTESEMGHLYYSEGITDESPGLFADVRPYMYWSGTDYDLDKAWRFNFKTGYQNTSDKEEKRYVWAMRNGKSSPPVVPEPVSSLLFIAGGATLAIKRIRRTGIR